MQRIRPHIYVPDVSVEPNHRGERPCAQCPLPEANTTVHHELSDDDVTDRILGEADV